MVDGGLNKELMENERPALEKDVFIFLFGPSQGSQCLSFSTVRMGS